MICRGGFTLVELLVSMTVLVLIIAMLAQVVQNTTSSIQRSTKGMDTNRVTTIALDRIGNSISGMVSSGPSTLVALKNVNGSDGLAMITNGRVRSRTSATDSSITDANVSVSSSSDIRLSARGYCVINVSDPDLQPTSGSTFPLVPMLHWGDGTITWTPQSSATKYVQGDPSQALSLAVMDISAQILATTNSSGSPVASNMLQFLPLSRSIFRFEVCFLLSDGSLISSPSLTLPKHAVLNRRFVANDPANVAPNTVPMASVTFDPAGSPPCFALAFNSLDSDDLDSPKANLPKLYVRAVVVGIASLDANTLKLLSPAQLATLSDLNMLPKAVDGQTPSQMWDISSSSTPTYQYIVKNFPPPVLQNIRFTQRYFYVN